MSTALTIAAILVGCVAAYELDRIADALEKLAEFAQRRDELEVARIRRDGPRGVVR